MSYYTTFIIAAVSEIGSCFAFWSWLRLDKSAWWVVPGIGLLVLFAYSLTRIDISFAGRAFAAYGGLYIVASLVWLRIVEKQTAGRWDIIGAAICIGGSGVILFGPREKCAETTFKLESISGQD